MVASVSFLFLVISTAILILTYLFSILLFNLLHFIFFFDDCCSNQARSQVSANKKPT